MISQVKQAERTQNQLSLAERLVTALQRENVRWAESMNKLSADKATMAGDVLLTAAFITYCGPFNQKYRQKLIEELWSPDILQTPNKC